MSELGVVRSRTASALNLVGLAGWLVLASAGCTMPPRSSTTLQALRTIATTDGIVTEQGIISAFDLKITAFSCEDGSGSGISDPLICRTDAAGPLIYVWLASGTSGIGLDEEVRLSVTEPYCVTPGQASRFFGKTYRDSVRFNYTAGMHGDDMKLVRDGVLFKLDQGEWNVALTLWDGIASVDTCISSFRINKSLNYRIPNLPPPPPIHLQ